MIWDWDYPVPAFVFQIEMDGSDAEASFQEVSGLEVRLDVEAYKAGGENNIIYQLPVRTTYQPLILKRGVCSHDSNFVTWVHDCLLDETNLSASFGDNLKDLTVHLMNPNSPKESLISWKLLRAYPVKWNLGTLNSQQNALAIETIEIVYQKITTE